MVFWDPTAPDNKIEIKIGAAEHKVESDLKNFKSKRWWLYPLAIIFFIAGAILFYQTGEYNGTSNLNSKQAKGFMVFLFPAIVAYVLRSAALENKAYHVLSVNESWGYEPRPSDERSRLLEKYFKNHIFGSADFEDEIWGSFKLNNDVISFYSVWHVSKITERSLFAVKLLEPVKQHFLFYGKGDLISFEGIETVPKELAVLLRKMRKKAKYFTVEISGDEAIISINDKVIDGAFTHVEKDEKDHLELKFARRHISYYTSFLVNCGNALRSNKELFTIDQAMKTTFRMSFITKMLFLLLIFYSFIFVVAVFVIIFGDRNIL
jgi:hypothetical protein